MRSCRTTVSVANSELLARVTGEQYSKAFAKSTPGACSPVEVWADCGPAGERAGGCAWRGRVGRFNESPATPASLAGDPSSLPRRPTYRRSEAWQTEKPMKGPSA